MNVYAAPVSYRVVVRLHELKNDGIASEGPDLKLVPGGYGRPAVAREDLISPEAHCFELVGRFPYILILYQAADSGAGGIVNIRALAATLVAGLIIYVFKINTRVRFGHLWSGLGRLCVGLYDMRPYSGRLLGRFWSGLVRLAM